MGSALVALTAASACSCLALCSVDAFITGESAVCAGRRQLDEPAHTLRSAPTETSSEDGTNRRQEDIILPPKPQKSTEESTFWKSVPQRQRPTEGEIMPCEPHLDADGPLPFGSYRIFGRPEYEPARTCLVTVAFDLTPEGRALDPASASAGRPRSGAATNEGFDAKVAVRNAQKLIDSGFTSFQIACNDSSAISGADDGREGIQRWVEENVFGLLRRETPASVMRNCHLTTRIRVPPKDSGPFGNGKAVREAVGASLRRMGSDCIDTVQVPYCQDSPYHLDTLNALSEMQEEGIIRSISGLDIPPSILTSAEACMFHLDSNQVRCNLLDPTPFDEISQICSEMNTKALSCSPLAGGLLTDKYSHQPQQPNRLYLSRSEQQHIESSLPLWAKQHVDNSYCSDWERFHRLVLSTLGEISYKHQVTMASVALRWSMHLGNLGSVVVGSRLGLCQDDESLYTRPKTLREVFKFELEEEDIKRLCDISGRRKRQYPPDTSSKYLGREDFDGEFFVPGSSNRNLWF